MATERLVVFADKSIDAPHPTQPSYQLLALPPALLSLLTSSSSSSSSSGSAAAPLEIRGDPHDGAVLVSPTQTFTLRGVQNSNSLCVCAAGAASEGKGRARWFVPASGSAVEGEMDVDEEDGDDEVEEPARKKLRREQIEIEAVLHETLEAVPGVARTDKLDGLLKGCEYDGEAGEEERSEGGQPNPRQKHTFASVRSRLPASDAEIRTALSRKRVVTLDDFLRPLPPTFLLSVLPSILATLPLPAQIAHPAPAAAASKKHLKSKPSKAAPLPSSAVAAPLYAEALDADLLDALDAVDCGNDAVARQVLAWFGGEVEGAHRRTWKVDARVVVKEVGVVLMADGGYGQQAVDPFLARWKELCRGFARVCDLSLLAGLHLHRPAPLSTLQYLPPSSLSPDPATRFAELFALKPRWLEADLALFVDDLTGGDKKRRDALVLKFVRKVKEGQVTWWTARNLWT
ncbi:hypothetical protein JCM10207_009268 [Rhodosporidiobolus poonsookiae]